MISVVREISGIAARSFSTSARYCSFEYFRFMRFKISLLPDWSGRCKWLQIFFESRIVSISSSERSFGWEVMKRMRSSPSIFSTLLKSSAKVIGRSRFFP